MFKVNIKDIRTCHWRLSGVFNVNFEQVSLIVLMFLLLTLLGENLTTAVITPKKPKQLYVQLPVTCEFLTEHQINF